MARIGCKYIFEPVLMDHNIAPAGTLVEVMPASSLGVSGRLPSRFAYVKRVDDGTVLGMVCASSLQPRKPRRLSAMAIAADACGLTRVRVNGKTFYE